MDDISQAPEITQVVVWYAGDVPPPDFVFSTTALIQPIDNSVHVVLNYEGLQALASMINNKVEDVLLMQKEKKMKEVTGA